MEINFCQQVPDLPKYWTSERGKVFEIVDGFLDTLPPTFISNQGYLYVKAEGEKYYQPVHRLVAASWLESQSKKKKAVLHIDGKRENCDVDNLKYVSIKRYKKRNM
jgi:hypothetical protein